MTKEEFRVVEVKQERFNLVKFLSGFANIGKILFFFVLFAAFTYAQNTMLPSIKRQVQTQNIETYVEASESKPMSFFGIKIARVGLGIVVDKK